MNVSDWKKDDGWRQDGWAHARDEHGTCINCGASKNEYHYKLLPEEPEAEGGVPRG